MKTSLLAAAVLSTALLAGCNNDTSNEAQAPAMASDNPFLAPSTLYMQYPPFDKIKNELKNGCSLISLYSP